MTKTCSVISCMKTSSKTISVHKVPSTDVGQKWRDFISYANREYRWKETKTLYQCSQHFKNDTFTGQTLWRTRVQTSGVPCILDGIEVSLPNGLTETLIKPLPLFDNLQFVHTKPCMQDENSPQQIQIFPVDHSKCHEDLRKRDEKIMRLTAELNECKNELQNCKRRLERANEMKRRLREDRNAPPSKLEKASESDISTNATATNSFRTLMRELNLRADNPSVPYSDKLKEFAFNMHYFSPRAYEFLRKEFQKTLPHSRNFNRWTTHIRISPGFLQNSLDFIKEKVTSKKETLYFCLSFDEIHIRKQIIYNNGHFAGFTENGGIIDEPESDKEASAALFVMATEINGKQKIPIAYILTNGLPGHLMKAVISKSLQKMHQIGGTVISLTFDGLRSNLTAVELLGAHLDPMNDNFSPYILHPCSQEKVYIFLDPSHMFKLLRNFLKTQELIDFEGNKVRWSYIERLHSLQLACGLKAANKLSTRHLAFENQKMKTKLCVQTMSNSVSVALGFCRKIGVEGFEGSEGTENFLKTFDRLYDAMNSQRSGQGYKSPLSKLNENVWTSFFDHCKHYLLNLRVEKGGKLVPLLKTGKGTPIKGLIGSIATLQMIMRNIVLTGKMKYLPTYRMGQDMLETFFSLIRSRFGFNNNPNVLQLQHALKGILCSKLASINSGNCVEQEELSIKISRFKSLSAVLSEEDVVNSKEQPDNEEEMPVLSTFVKCIITYIAGYVTRNLLSSLRCVDCMVLLYPSQEDQLEHCELIDEKDNGGLVKPTSAVVNVCNIVEQKIRINQDHGLRNMSSSLIITSVIKECTNAGLLPLLDCKTSKNIHESFYLIQAIASEFVKIRLHHLARESTLKLNPTTNRNVCNKIVHFQGN